MLTYDHINKENNKDLAIQVQRNLQKWKYDIILQKAKKIKDIKKPS